MKIAILSSIKEWNLGYSVVGIVEDQITMLLEHGHEVVLFLPEDFKGSVPFWPCSSTAAPFLSYCSIPKVEMFDYQKQVDLSDQHKKDVEKITTFLTKNLDGFDFVFTHDWMFTGWHLPYSLAVKAADLLELNWWHWVHSTPPRERKDWWDLPSKKHKIIIPNQVYKPVSCGAFVTTPEQVRTIPHIKDLRTWYDFSEETKKFIKTYPAIMQSNIVQVYPAACDRLTCKQIDKVIMLFGAFKRRGLSVCLVIANQWATTLQRKEDIEKFRKLAHREGLIEHGEFIYTSDSTNDFGTQEYEKGISRQMLRELMLCANFFVFPTKEESFGLVGPEAALSGNFMVLNKSLSVMSEVFRHSGLSMAFGSWEANLTVGEGWKKYLYDYAGCIMSRMGEDETFCTRSLMRRLYNYDTIHNTYYEPLMQECLKCA